MTNEGCEGLHVVQKHSRSENSRAHAAARTIETSSPRVGARDRDPRIGARPETN